MGRYLHEKAMNDAVGNLYMLGRRPVPQTNSGWGQQLGSAMSALGKKKKQPKGSSPVMFNAGTEQQSEWDSNRGGTVIPGSNEDRFEQMKAASYANGPNGLMPTAFGPAGSTNQVTASVAKDAIANIAKKSQETHKNNETASGMRFGGKFTEAGLQMAHSNATADAIDRQKAFGIMAGAPQVNAANDMAIADEERAAYSRMYPGLGPGNF